MSLERVEPTEADLATNQVRFRVNVDVRPFLEAVAKAQAEMARNLAAWYRRNLPPLVALGPVKPRDRHHPRPLPIDGHAYARRRKARARRKARR